MTATVTWTTVPIPAHRLAVGDLIPFRGRRMPTAAVVELNGDVILEARDDDGLIRAFIEGRNTVAVCVPNEPVDGYSLWKPKPYTFMSGCVCTSRRDDGGNWHPITTDPDCRRHGIHDDWED